MPFDESTLHSISRASESITLDRRQTVLPPFVRITWASRGAEERWAPRFRSIAATSREVGIQAVVHGHSPCYLCRAVPCEVIQLRRRLSQYDVDVVVIGEHWPEILEPVRPSMPVAPLLLTIAIGRTQGVDCARYAWERRLFQEMLVGIGWPHCCSQAMCERQTPQPWMDLTWHVAAKSLSGESVGHTLEVPEAWGWHTLLRPLGLHVIDHIPCSSQCHQSFRLHETRIDIMKKHGFDSEADWLLEILAWPVEWSSLHGIAELRTPLCKVSTRTDSLATKRTVRVLSERYPDDAPFGVGFPFRQPVHFRSSSSRSFQKGISNPIN
jgi:hypothetical protein